ncbi:tyrosine-protein phosphatase-like protein Oca2p [Trichomonascus vanleenenianus]|uniref:Oca2p n=1 Tax=Trichomonascus vanleenenianus TaxID=2268995 RepID=UPI003EC9F653
MEGMEDEVSRTTLFVPPLNFALVAEGVYRSGHPLPINYPFLESLELKTIIYLGERSDEENEEYIKWANSHGIKFLRFYAPSVKEPFVGNSPEAITSALQALLDTRNFPVLVHSNKGKHRVGVLVGVMRKVLQRWSLATIFDEYSRFATGKGDADVEFIELFEPELTIDPNNAPEWLRRPE